MIRLPFVFFVTLLCGGFFPWWWPAVPGLLIGFWRPAHLARGFFAAALGGGAAWAVVALWFDVRNQGLLSDRVGLLFHMPDGTGLIAATALVGGVTAGLGALFGARFRLFWGSLQDALADVAAPVPDEER